jgi:hypothetical protein
MKSENSDQQVKLALTKQLELLNPLGLNNIIQMKFKKITRLQKDLV